MPKLHPAPQPRHAMRPSSRGSWGPSGMDRQTADGEALTRGTERARGSCGCFARFRDVSHARHACRANSASHELPFLRCLWTARGRRCVLARGPKPSFAGASRRTPARVEIRTPSGDVYSTTCREGHWRLALPPGEPGEFVIVAAVTSGGRVLARDRCQLTAPEPRRGSPRWLRWWLRCHTGRTGRGIVDYGPD